MHLSYCHKIKLDVPQVKAERGRQDWNEGSWHRQISRMKALLVGETKVATIPKVKAMFCN